jgi:hypothetical protein
MADERPEPMKAINTTFTPPQEDLKEDRRDIPAGAGPKHERVEARGPDHPLPPNYAGGPGHRLNPDEDPAAPPVYPPPARPDPVQRQDQASP